MMTYPKFFHDIPFHKSNKPVSPPPSGHNWNMRDEIKYLDYRRRVKRNILLNYMKQYGSEFEKY